MSRAKRSLAVYLATWRVDVASEKIAHVNGSERSRVQEFPSEKIARDIGLYNLMGMGRERKESLLQKEPTVAAEAASE